MVVVPVLAPICTLVAAPPKLIVVAVVSIKLNVDWVVVRSPPFTLTSLLTSRSPPTFTLPIVLNRPVPISNVPVPLIFIPSPLLNSKSPVLSPVPLPVSYTHLTLPTKRIV